MNTQRAYKLNKLKGRGIYKYLSSKYIDDFVFKGNILFRNLTYFNNYEDNMKRGDVLDGAVYYKTDDGFEIFNASQNKSIKVKESFINIDTDIIFVCCFSKRLDESLFEEFESECCIEITDTTEFTKRIGRALRYKYFDYNDMKYYNTNENLHHTLIKPETIPFYKTLDYEHQDEFRYIFSDTKINPEIIFSTMPFKNEQLLELKKIENEDKLNIGYLEDITKVHFL